MKTMEMFHTLFIIDVIFTTTMITFLNTILKGAFSPTLPYMVTWSLKIKNDCVHNTILYVTSVRWIYKFSSWSDCIHRAVVELKDSTLSKSARMSGQEGLSVRVYASGLRGKGSLWPVRVSVSWSDGVNQRYLFANAICVSADCIHRASESAEDADGECRRLRFSHSHCCVYCRHLTGLVVVCTRQGTR